MFFVRLAAVVLAFGCVVAAARAQAVKGKAAGCFVVHQATGPQRINEGRAKGAAIKAWQREVVGIHGAEAAVFERAREIKFSCYPASVGGFSTQCRVTARPCKA